MKPFKIMALIRRVLELHIHYKMITLKTYNIKIVTCQIITNKKTISNHFTPKSTPYQNT